MDIDGPSGWISSATADGHDPAAAQGNETNGESKLIMATTTSGFHRLTGVPHAHVQFSKVYSTGKNPLDKN